jgi:HEAT repeat protein
MAEHSDAQTTLCICLGLQLRERLDECPSVRRVSDARADAIFSEVQGGKREFSRERLLADFSEFLPVDAVIDFGFKEDSFELEVHRQDGIRRHSFPFKAGTVTQAVVYEAAKRVAEDWGLPDEEKRILTEVRIPNPDSFQAYYVSQRTYAAWPNNSGEYRLKLLRPPYDKDAGCVPLAAEMLRSADVLLASRSRVQDFAGKGVAAAKVVLPVVLGTKFEVCAHGIVAQQPDAFEADLLALASPLIRTGIEDAEKAEEMDEPGEGAAGDGMKIDVSAPEAIAGAVAAEAKTPIEKRLGALRMLGVMRSEKGLEVVLKATKHRQERVREAAAAALRWHAEDRGVAELRALAKDKDVKVAFLAAYSLWKRKVEAGSLLPLAGRMLQEEAGHDDGAVEALSELGTKEHLPAIETLAQSPKPDNAVKALLRLGGLSRERYHGLLSDPDDALVVAALGAFPKEPDDQLLLAAQRLANDPLSAVAQAARLALTPHRPAVERDRRLFDLAVEHPYVRRKLVDELAASKEPWALDDLEAVYAKLDAHSRAYALKRLAEIAPDRAEKRLLQAVRDPYRWVRLHAAAMLAKTATAGSAAAVREALKPERNEATRLYLEDALARAEGRPAPPPRPAARSVRGQKNLTWLCGAGIDSETSPFDAYYCLSVGVGETWKKAYQAGKIFFGRVETVGNPGQIIVDPDWQDRFWIAVEGQLNAANLPYLDGLVFGEETMSAQPDALWPEGWRLFCLDAGIDPVRVQGDQAKLSVSEARAWKHWALQRLVDGFNVLYDYVHLYYGKLRPGIQVATFLPEQGLLGVGANPGDLRWKFDVGGLYHYKGCTWMAAYNMVRRYKTLWPDRPIIWLSLGIGGYEMNPVKRTLDVPTRPLTWRGDRAWADSVTAYMAGADTGFFSVWIFVAKDWKGGMHSLSGVQVLAEDITPDSPLLQAGIEHSFRGVEEEYALKLEGQPKLKVDVRDTGDKPAEDGDDEAVELALTGEMSQKEKIALQVKADKRRFRQGFHFYRKYVYDCARILSCLPRQNPKPASLVIQPDVNVWTHPSTAHPLVPGMAILNSYDFLCDINKTPDLDLSRYRLIVSHNPPLLTDRTIAAVTKWLSDCPGLLYVHLNLPADNAAEASTPDDHDGVLKNDWPWEADVSVAPGQSGSKQASFELSCPKGKVSVDSACLASTFALNGPNAQALLSAEGKPCLVLWRDPKRFKGAVLFDGMATASADYLTALKATLNGLRKDLGAGVELRGAILHQTLETDLLTAAATTAYYGTVSEKRAYPGVDLLTGEPNPVVGGGRSGTVTAKDFRGRYVACVDGLAILSEKPIQLLEKLADGLLVQTDGLFRAASETGAVKVTKEDGRALSLVEDWVDWLLFGEEEGAVCPPIDDTGNQVVYVRSQVPARVVKAAASGKGK